MVRPSSDALPADEAKESGEESNVQNAIGRAKTVADSG